MGWWSATVMGGDTPLDCLGGIMDLALGPAVYRGDNPEALTKEILNSRLDEIVVALDEEDDYYDWQVLGVLIMERGGGMPEGVRDRIKDAINRDERALDGNKERLGYMWEFFQKVRDYDGSSPVEVTHEGLLDKFVEVFG